jgi:hypothetical protein
MRAYPNVDAIARCKSAWGAALSRHWRPLALVALGVVAVGLLLGLVL